MPSKAWSICLVDAAGRRAAVHLADVLRIEQIPLSRIEYIGYRPVLNFEGQLMPVEDTGGVLAASGPDALSDPASKIIVVVCREGNRHVGIAVRTCSTWPREATCLKPELRSEPAALRCSRIASQTSSTLAESRHSPPPNTPLMNGTARWRQSHELTCLM